MPCLRGDWLFARSPSFGGAYASCRWPLAEQAAELETLAVLPAARGSGIGSALLDAVREERGTLKITEIGLHIVPTNHDAIRLYERHGFSPFAVWLRSGS